MVVVVVVVVVVIFSSLSSAGWGCAGVGFSVGTVMEVQISSISGSQLTINMRDGCIKLTYTSVPLTVLHVLYSLVSHSLS